MQIAIDGPAGAGKSTVARAVASALGYKYIDTGAMYRALGVALGRRGVDTKQRDDVLEALADVKIHVFFRGDKQVTAVDGHEAADEIRTASAALAASDIAVFPEVRARLVELQRELARNYDVVMDGRDIASVVLPEADFKFYLTASPRARAERRHRDLLKLGRDVDVDSIEAEIDERDRQDMNRKAAPLVRTAEQVLIDTTGMTQQEAVDKMLSVIRTSA